MWKLNVYAEYNKDYEQYINIGNICPCNCCVAVGAGEGSEDHT